MSKLLTWSIPSISVSTSWDDRYLGNYERLFEDHEDKPFPTWEALFWIVKDHIDVRNPPRVAMDVMDFTERAFREPHLPVAVSSDPRYCPYPRQYLWSQRANLDSKWYNWPKIEGKFGTVEECVQAYSMFSMAHHDHRDPVCFRATVFAEILAYLCHNYQFVVDYRVGARLSTDMEIFSKLHYHSARRLRALELMCIMQFLPGAHKVMISDACEEFGTRADPVKAF